MPGPTGPLVHESGQRLGVEKRQQRDEEDADQHRQRRDVKLPGTAGGGVHNRAEVLLGPGPVDHAHYQAGEQDEQLGAGYEAHRFLGEQLDSEARPKWLTTTKTMAIPRSKSTRESLVPGSE